MNAICHIKIQKKYLRKYYTGLRNRELVHMNCNLDLSTSNHCRKFVTNYTNFWTDHFNEQINNLIYHRKNCPLNDN